MNKSKGVFSQKEVYIVKGNVETWVGRFAFFSDKIRIMNDKTVSDCIDIKINSDNLELNHLWYFRELCEHLKHLVEIPLFFAFLNILAQSLKKNRILLSNSASVKLPHCEFKLDRFMPFLGKMPYYSKLGFHYVQNGDINWDDPVDFDDSDDEVKEWAVSHGVDRATLKEVLDEVYQNCNGEEEFSLYSSIHAFLHDKFYVGDNVMEKNVQAAPVQVFETASEVRFVIRSDGRSRKKKRRNRSKRASNYVRLPEAELFSAPQ